MMEDFGRTYDDSYADLIEQGATKVILADGLELELRPCPMRAVSTRSIRVCSS